MSSKTFLHLLHGTSAIAFLALTMSPATAQDTQQQTPPAAQPPALEEEVTEEASDGDIVVTGSRIKKSTYNSIAPVQVITTEDTQDAGLFDAATILQQNETSAGERIDATFSGFVLNNGPGSQTANLRGLGADRTLLLINGRRLAPAGVEGAPTNPSLNLIPSSLVDRYDLLTDGASSVYGSDAVAGVGNIILKKDFDGFEINLSGNLNPQGGGDDYTISGAWGFNNDRGFIGVGLEYDYQDAVKLRDRDFLAGCDRHYEITNTGEIRTLGIRDNALVARRTPGVRVSDNACKVTGISGRIFIPNTNYGSVYFTPGAGNTRIPGYNENLIFNREVDRNGDGLRDVDFQDVNTNGGNPTQEFIFQEKLYNAMAYGQHTFDGSANITPFFEVLYSRSEVFSANSGAFQIFPWVPATNAFNPCNRANPNGVDCRLAENLAFADFRGTRGPLATGADLPVQPITAIRGDRTNFDVSIEQYRFVGGVKGDLPFISPSWTFEFSSVYSKSKGKSTRVGIREDKLALALGIDPTADFNGDGVVDNNGDGIADDYDPSVLLGGALYPSRQLIAPCNVAALANPTLVMPDLAAGCVPVNLFAPSVLTGAIGDFATAAERDYVFGRRDFTTKYEQVVLSAFATGNIFSLPAGDVGVVVGGEYRVDKIASLPSDVANNGLLISFFVDRGAQGSKWIREAFAEVDIPLMADQPFVRDLTLNVSGRLTDEQYYGTAGTYAIKAGWRPIDPLLVKFSYGTSFRAPNLRENFLSGQTGFLTLFDPCAVPVDAFQNNAYDATLDDREATTLANCRREGRDPTRVGIDAQSLNTVTTSSVEIVSGGSLDLNPETSRSITTGFAFEEDFGGFKTGLNFNYYDIKIKGAIIEPSSQFILNDCYAREDGTRSTFCDRITTSNSVANRFLVTDVAAGFINLNREGVRGIDLNAFVNKDVTMFGKSVGLGLNVRANHLLERSSVFIDDAGAESFDEDAGEFGFPKWTGTATFTADIDKFRFTWQTRYIGPVNQQADGVDEFDDAFGNNGTGFFGDTCTGLGPTGNGVGGDGVFCRDVGYAKKYFTHTVSLRYSSDTWTLRAGITNLFDKDPPRVDSNEVFAIANTPIGNGYNLDGREFFLALNKEF